MLSKNSWATRKRKNLTTQVTAKHKIQNEEAILIILECVPKIDNKRMVDLKAQKT